jgi:hypothetical protein
MVTSGSLRSLGPMVTSGSLRSLGPMVTTDYFDNLVGVVGGV